MHICCQFSFTHHKEIGKVLTLFYNIRDENTQLYINVEMQSTTLIATRLICKQLLQQVAFLVVISVAK